MFLNISGLFMQLKFIGSIQNDQNYMSTRFKGTPNGEWRRMNRKKEICNKDRVNITS